MKEPYIKINIKELNRILSIEYLPYINILYNIILLKSSIFIYMLCNCVTVTVTCD